MTAGKPHPGTLEIALLTTGGTIEKTYDAHHGLLANSDSVLDGILTGLELDHIRLHRIPIMCKDSLDMIEEDHIRIAEVALREASHRDGVVLVHGTDRLARTGEAIASRAGGEPHTPIVLTGAMRPWIMRDSDAAQNITEALLAVQLLEPGVYVCLHSRVLRFPGVIKDRERLRFIHVDESQRPTDTNRAGPLEES